MTSSPSRLPLAGGLGRDTADQARLRHARDRNLGFPVGRYLQPAPMLFTRDGHNVFLGDLYRGRSAFLLGGGPSLITHDLELLRHRGILACAMNNAATVARPQLWVSVDDPGNFADVIWRDPGIMKFVPLCHMEKHFTVRNDRDELVPSQEVVGDMPAVFGYRRNESFEPAQWLYEDSFNWGSRSDWVDSLGCKGSRSVMYVALRLLYYLGVRRLYLLGCDFRMSVEQPNYAFAQDRSVSSVRNNNSTYEILNIRLGNLLPHFVAEGYEIFNCTPNSGLTVFPHVPYEQAIAEVRAGVPARINTAGMYERQAQHARAARNGHAFAPSTDFSEGDPGVLPELTIVTAVGPKELERFRHTWGTWLAFRPQLQEVSVLILHDPGMVPASEAWQFLHSHANVRFRPVAPDCRYPGRDAWSHAYLTAASDVHTPWLLKLEPEAIALPARRWFRNEWFEADEEGAPAIVAARWGYARPSDIIARLDEWGDRSSVLREFPRLNASYSPAADRIEVPTLSTWCAYIRTDWARELVALAPHELPCASFDTFVYYCAARQQARAVRVNMKQHGWEHAFSGQARIPTRCRELLAQHAKSAAVNGQVDHMPAENGAEALP